VEYGERLSRTGRKVEWCRAMSRLIAKLVNYVGPVLTHHVAVHLTF